MRVSVRVCVCVSVRGCVCVSVRGCVWVGARVCGEREDYKLLAVIHV